MPDDIHSCSPFCQLPDCRRAREINASMDPNTAALLAKEMQDTLWEKYASGRHGYKDQMYYDAFGDALQEAVALARELP